MILRAREPLSEAEGEQLTRLARGNALTQQRQADREAQQALAVTALQSNTPSSEAGF